MVYSHCWHLPGFLCQLYPCELTYAAAVLYAVDLKLTAEHAGFNVVPDMCNPNIADDSLKFILSNPTLPDIIHLSSTSSFFMPFLQGLPVKFGNIWLAGFNPLKGWVCQSVLSGSSINACSKYIEELNESREGGGHVMLIGRNRNWTIILQIERRKRLIFFFWLVAGSKIEIRCKLTFRKELCSSCLHYMQDAPLQHGLWSKWS